MSSKSGKNVPEKELESLPSRFENKVTINEGAADDVNKPDSREIDLGSPISPLGTGTRARGGLAAATTTTSSSSSSSSGPVSDRRSAGPNLHQPKTSNPRARSRSGELSVESFPKSDRKFKPSHTRSMSSESHSLSPSISTSATSSAAPIMLPAGNIVPSGKVVTTGMERRLPKTEVLGSGRNYGHGSIMRGSPASKPGSSSYSRGPTVGGEPGKGAAGLPSSNDPEELKRMGNVYYKKGNFVEALGFYEKAVALSPYSAAYHFNRAAALMGLKRLGEAVKEYEEAIRLDPGYVRAHQRLGSLLLSLGDIENARIHICFPGHQLDPLEVQKLQSVEKHLIKCTDARRVGDWRITLKEVDAAIASGADASPQLFACRAEALLKLHRLDDAFLALSNVPRSDPSSSPLPLSKIFGMLSEAYICLVRAQIEMAWGRFDSALAESERAGRIEPHNAEISDLHNNVKLVGRARARGNDLFRLERFTEACIAYEEGLRYDPSNPVLYCNRAACRFKLGQWERTVDDCSRALRIQPNYTKALLRRAASNSKLERWNEAVQDYEVLKRELPDDNEVAESLFHAQIALKKSRGEEVSNMIFGGEVQSVSRLEQLRAAISSPGVTVVHFKAESNAECKKISPFFDTLCTRYPSVNFLKVDIEESPAIVHAENIRMVPTFKIYRNGTRIREIVCPSREILESSLRLYGL